MKKLNIYEVVTDKIIEQLEKGKIPWQKPWDSIYGMPCNMISKKPYRGMNTLLLGCSGHKSPFFMTFKQVNSLGGSIKKGEKANLVIFYRWIEIKDENKNPIIDEDEEIKKIPLLRYYNLFNLEQCTDIPENKIPKPKKYNFNPIQEAELTISKIKNPPKISFEDSEAFYIPSDDIIHMPPKTSFKCDEEMYSTLFHELVHSTGHESRLKRKGVFDKDSFGSKVYSKEELVAEIGSAFLCSISGIENKTMDNSTAYIAGWLSKLRDNKKIIIQAAGQAQKACDFILNKNSFKEEKTEQKKAV